MYEGIKEFISGDSFTILIEIKYYNMLENKKLNVLWSFWIAIGNCDLLKESILKHLSIALTICSVERYFSQLKNLKDKNDKL